MGTSFQLYVFIAILAFGSSEPEIVAGVKGAVQSAHPIKTPSSFKTYLFKVLGFGDSNQVSIPTSFNKPQQFLPQQQQFEMGPCGIQYTTTAAPTLCPYPRPTRFPQALPQIGNQINPYPNNQFPQYPSDKNIYPNGNNPFPNNGNNPFPNTGNNPFPNNGNNPFPNTGNNPFPNNGNNPFPNNGNHPFPNNGNNPFPNNGNNPFPNNGNNAFVNNGNNPFPNNGNNAFVNNGNNPLPLTPTGNNENKPFPPNPTGNNGINPFPLNPTGNNGINPFPLNPTGNNGNNDIPLIPSGNKPFVLKPSDNNGNNPIPLIPSGNNVNNPIPLIPSGNNVNNPIPIIPSGNNANNPVPLNPSGNNPNNPIPLIPSGNNPNNPIPLIPSGNNGNNPIPPIPFENNGNNPVIFKPSGNKPFPPNPTGVNPISPIIPVKTPLPINPHTSDPIAIDPLGPPVPIFPPMPDRNFTRPPNDGPFNPLPVSPNNRPNDPSIVHPENPNDVLIAPPVIKVPPVKPLVGIPTGVDPSQILPPFIPTGNKPLVIPSPIPVPVKPGHINPNSNQLPPLPLPLHPDDIHNHPHGKDAPLPCSALRSFIPSGFSVASTSNYTTSQCPLMSLQHREGPPCSMLEALDHLSINKFRKLVYKSGLDPMFLRTNGYTLLAPLDIAFAKVPQWIVSSLETDKNLQLAFVLNHLLKGDYPLNSFRNEDLILNARPGDNRIRVNVYFDDFPSPIYTVDGARIIRGDVVTSTGRIHIVDKVVMPNPPRYVTEYLSERTELESFWNIIKMSDKVKLYQKRSNPITLFVPISTAVDRMMENLRRHNETLDSERFVDYHIVKGTHYSSGLINNQFLVTNYLNSKEIKIGVSFDSYSKYLASVNGHIKVLKSDIPLLNGVAHIIDDCIDTRGDFYTYDEMDEFDREFGVISKRSMKITGEEKELHF